MHSVGEWDVLYFCFCSLLPAGAHLTMDSIWAHFLFHLFIFLYHRVSLVHARGFQSCLFYINFWCIFPVRFVSLVVSCNIDLKSHHSVGQNLVTPRRFIRGVRGLEFDSFAGRVWIITSGKYPRSTWLFYKNKIYVGMHLVCFNRFQLVSAYWSSCLQAFYISKIWYILWLLDCCKSGR